MAKKTAKTKPAKKKVAPPKKGAKPAAVKSKKSAKPAKAVKSAVKAKAVKPTKKATPKPVKKAVKVAPKPVKVLKKAKPAPTAKPVAKPAAKGKVVTKPAVRKVEKPAAKAKAPAKGAAKVIPAAPKAAGKPAKVVQKPVTKVAVKPAVAAKEKPAAKAEPAKVVVEAPVAPAPAEARKESVKTVEQQMQEKNTVSAEPAPKGAKSKEDLFVPKYQLPVVAETPRPMRPKPPTVLKNAPVKPVANPIYVPPAPDGKPGIKFAPIAVVERPKEKEKPNKAEEDDMSSKTSPRLALNESDDKKGISVEAKLRALYAIQLIDSRIDKIHAMRGELPLEVQDLEDDVTGLETRIKNLTDEVKNLSEEITGKKNGIKNSEALIKKYKEQLNNVKNNREFDSLNKEIEFQELEIQLHNKRIKEFEISAKTKQDILESTEVKLKERTNDLKLKRAELDEIVSSTEKEEKLLRKKSDEAKKLIEARLLSAYERIRSGAPNGMAVVPIEREASAGSFIQLPPQKQLDVAARRRVIVDEHSGRILVDAELAKEEQEKMEALLTSEMK